MATQAQIDAARRNGAKSNGPKTPEGKAISSANSLRHGMTAKCILLTNEDPEAYTKLAEAYYEKFQPADDVERDLVDEMIVAKWRQRRDWSNEAALFDLEMDRQTKQLDAKYDKIDHACRYALAFRALADESKAIQLFTRYETSHRRSYYKALATLLHLRTQPAPTPAPVEAPPPKNAPEVPENKECETNPTTSDRPASNDEPRTSDMPETPTNGENTPPLDLVNDKS
jgi:hypothetical protein